MRSARKFFMLGRSLDDLVAGRPPVCEPHRGYGVGAVVIQHEIGDGLPWRQAAAAAFGGQGSCGNGATTRVTPLGVYHPERPTVAAEEAIESAEVVHAHPEGVAGAVLVAVAAAHAGARLDGAPPPAAMVLDRLRSYLIEGALQRGIARAILNHHQCGQPTLRATTNLDKQGLDHVHAHAAIRASPRGCLRLTEPYEEGHLSDSDGF